MKPDFEKLGLELSSRVDKEYSVWNGQTCISLRGIEKLSQALQSAYEQGRSDERERADKQIYDLYKALDDIDTASDIAKDDDKLYRNLVRKAHERRFGAKSSIQKAEGE